MIQGAFGKRATAAALFASLMGMGAAPAWADASPAEFYSQTCAVCHGERGEGVEGAYEPPLHGELSVAELAEVIDQTMPLGAPEECVGEEARAVAEYVHGEFYSLAARRRAGLAAAGRVELARLTVEQHRNALADLIGRFAPAPERGDDRPGLAATYYQSDGMNKAADKKLERVDARVDFDFGAGSPHEEISADQFSIVWRGSLAAPHTGFYEFRVRTQNGARLYFNRDGLYGERVMRDDSSASVGTPLVDAWVGSGELRERTARVFLLGERRYPLRVEFFKYKDDSASVALEWKPPHGVWETLGDEHLRTGRAGRTFVADAPFPPDDASLGYERGAAVSAEWLSAVNAAALETAEEVVQRLPRLAGFEKGADDARRRAGDFAARLASAAFRRPLTEEEDRLYRDTLFSEAEGVDAGARRAVLAALTSPAFLYPGLAGEGEGPSQHAVAERLALALWDSLPDEELRAAAAEGRLATREEIAAQARRMLGDPRTRAKLHGFFEHWLELGERDLAKDHAMFPEFDERVAADLRRSLEMLIDHVVWSEASDYRELLLADYLFLNERLQELYGEQGAGAAADEQQACGFVKVPCRQGERAGVLTHPYLLSAFAYHNNTSPIHRGVFLTRNIMGRSLKPPPMAVAFRDAEFDPELTMREKVTLLTRDSACMACHEVINPLGFALENFDAVGRWRTREKDKPIDPQSAYPTADGATLTLKGARDVAEFAAQSEPAHRAFVRQMFHHLVKQDPTAYGPGTLEALREGFAGDDFHIRNLIARIAVAAASHGVADRESEEAEP